MCERGAAKRRRVSCINLHAPKNPGLDPCLGSNTFLFIYFLFIIFKFVFAVHLRTVSLFLRPFDFFLMALPKGKR